MLSSHCGCIAPTNLQINFFLYKIKYWKNNGPFSVKPLIYSGVEIFQKTQLEQSRFFL